MLFSERYGYVKPSDVIIKEQITPEMQNAICSCYDRLSKSMSYGPWYTYEDLERYLWTYFLNRREANFQTLNGYHIVATNYLEDKATLWFRKFDLIEYSIKYLRSIDSPATNEFIDQLNADFKRLNFAYRIINDLIVEITSEEEIVSIEKSLQESEENVKSHISKSLELYSQRPQGDYCNSIKESISAVEAYCRERTGESTLGNALNKLQISIPEIMKSAFEKLYAYTNQPETGIRHALMDKDGKYVPGPEEALFMLVSCCSFINYLRRKS